VDEQLRKLQRQSLSDPEAKDKHIALLERLAGLGNDKPIKVWTAEYIPEKASLAYVICVSLSEKAAQKEAARHVIEMLNETMFIHADEDPPSGESFLNDLDKLFFTGEYKKVVDAYIEEWTNYTEEVRIYSQDLITN